MGSNIGMIEITKKPISPEFVVGNTKTDNSGCVVTYVGLIRSHSHGKAVLSVEYKDARGIAENRLWEIAGGGDPSDERPAGPAASQQWERGVFSVQFELRPPTDERDRIRAALRAVAEEVARKLRQRGQAARQVKLTLVFRDMRKVGVRRTLRQPTPSAEVLFQAVGALFDRMRLNGRQVRRVRITVAHLAVGPDGGQMGLPLLERDARRDRLAEQVHQAKDRYGETAVARASALALARR